jgi:hypothetical protein
VKRIFGFKSEYAKGGWRKFHNEEHHDFYFSPNSMMMTPKSMRISEECSIPEHGRSA